MPTFFRNTNWTTVTVVALVGLLFVIAVFTGGGDAGRAFDPASNAPDGLLLLRLWLEEMGYDVRMDGQTGFDLPTVPSTSTGDGALLLVYPGSRDFSKQEAERLYNWIEMGNSAAFFLPMSVDQELSRRFNIASNSTAFGNEKVTQPLVADSAGIEQLAGGFGNTLELEQIAAAVPVIASEEGEPVIAVQRIGKGTGWFLSTRYTFTNDQLNSSAESSHSAQAGHLIPLLRTVPAGGIVQLDTYHLFGSLLGDEQEITSIQGWLYYTAVGNATLFAVLVIGLYLLLQGWRLGPALPTQEQMRRREAAEYVVAMANLYRRGAVTGDVAAYQKQRLKQALGRPLHLDATLADGEFVKTLRGHDPNFSAERSQKVTNLLNSLDHADADSLISSAVEIDQLLKEMKRGA